MSTYKIKKGDTLSGIAKKHNTTVNDLLKLNPHITNVDKIKINDTIIVSEESSSVKKTNPKETKRYSLENNNFLEYIRSLNEGQYTQENDVTTVNKGDTLWDIARNNGMSLDELIELNPQIKKNKNGRYAYYVGDIIKLKKKSYNFPSFDEFKDIIKKGKIEKIKKAKKEAEIKRTRQKTQKQIDEEYREEWGEEQDKRLLEFYRKRDRDVLEQELRYTNQQIDSMSNVSGIITDEDRENYRKDYPYIENYDRFYIYHNGEASPIITKVDREPGFKTFIDRLFNNDKETILIDPRTGNKIRDYGGHSGITNIVVNTHVSDIDYAIRQRKASKLADALYRQRMMQEVLSENKRYGGRRSLIY